MKKKIKISTAIPASMSGFLATENPHLTTATLKVFHSGETGDGRLFTKGFADKIAATIGGTPVVARYDEETDDFIGHAGSQSVFGFVPEQPDIRTETDINGNSWLITDVKLFTERHDVGSIAKRIVGRSQSLELDPDSLDVKFVYDENEEFDKIEFHNGNLIGLSVLGLDQQPAFEGSGFFTKAIKADELEELIAKYNTIPTSIVMETGGKSMNKKDFIDGQSETKDDIADNEKLKPEFDPRMNDSGQLINDKGEAINEDGHLIDSSNRLINDSGHLVDSEGNLINEEGKKVNDLGQLINEEGKAVNESGHLIDEEDNLINEDGDRVNEEGELVGEDGLPLPVEDEDEPDMLGAGAEDEDETEVLVEDEVSETDSNEGEGDDFESNEEKPKEDRVEPEAKEESANAASLSEAERAELESYRRADKIGIINSYGEYLSEVELEEFRSNVDAFEKVELDKELSFKSMQALKNKTENKPTFSFEGRGMKSSDPLTDAIQNYRGEQ